MPPSTPDPRTGSGSDGPAPSRSRLFSDVDEQRHPDVEVEAWWWWARSDDGRAGAFVGLELHGSERPASERPGAEFDYWAGIVRADEPYLYVEELGGRGLRGGLEIKPAEMWADHVCEIPFGQWSVGSEAHGVLLDDPTEAWRRAYGTLAPVTVDIEWYGIGSDGTGSEVMAIAHGYRQLGQVDVQIELTTGLLEFTGTGERVHVWGAPFVPSSFAMPIASPGLRAPYRRSDGLAVDQVLTDRWWMSRQAT